MPEAEVAKRSMTGSAAAAVLLMLFEDDEAAQILSRLEPDEVRQLGYAMYDVADVAVDEVNAALDQFVSKAKSRTTIGYGAGEHIRAMMHKALGADRADNMLARITRSEEHTSELQSLMRISYAVFCLKKKKTNTNTRTYHTATSHNKDRHR